MDLLERRPDMFFYGHHPQEQRVGGHSKSVREEESWERPSAGESTTQKCVTRDGGTEGVDTGPGPASAND